MGYMLNDITQHDEIELPKVFGAHLIYIVTDKVHACGVGVVGKAYLAHVYLGLVDVNTHTFATHIQERKQVSRFTTAYLQDAHGRGHRSLLLNVGNHIAAHTFRLLVEISVVVFVTLLHTLTLCILMDYLFPELVIFILMPRMATHRQTVCRAVIHLLGEAVETKAQRFLSRWLAQCVPAHTQ